MASEDQRQHIYTAQPFSNSAAGRLGEAIASGRKLSEKETELYRLFTVDALTRTTACTQIVKNMLNGPTTGEVLPRVASATVTGRPKTRKTLAEKLLRTHGLKLPAVHDVAGVRVVGSFSVFEQEQTATILRQYFDASIATSKPALSVDRLASPTYGYRALHLVVWPEGRPVEIQIRTDLQHAWAELMEVLGDRWGREPRYGMPVNHADDQERDRRQSIVDQLVAISENVAAFEKAAKNTGLAHVHVPRPFLESQGLDADALEQVQAAARDAEPSIDAVKKSLLAALTQFGVDADLDSDL